MACRPQAPLVADVADSIRRMSRLLWNVQLSLEEFTPELRVRPAWG